MLRTPARLLMVLACALLAAACAAGTPDVDEVGSCLEGLGLKVEAPPESDSDVEVGVFATTDLADAAEEPADAEFTFAMAAIVPEEDARSRFVDQSTSFARSAKADGKLEFDSGTDGEYVWVAGGKAGSDSFDDVLGCVKP